MKTDIAVIGGGLAGLALADHLTRAGLDFQLFEARDRFGGRVLSHPVNGAGFDMGPSWFWPGQLRMLSLLQRLGLRHFDQFSDGAISFEPETGEVVRNMGFASMQGSWRVEGGMQAIVTALIETLPESRLHSARAVMEIIQGQGVRFADGSFCEAKTVVLALPPRVAATLKFSPELSPTQVSEMSSIPTWMAGHAKFFAIYDQPFWRDGGLSGDAMSHRGPLAEIHDASAPSGTPAALFGFVGIAAQHRHGKAADVQLAALNQLARIFGPKAADPIKVIYKDWAENPATATQSDQTPPSHHPTYGLPSALAGMWDGALRFCVTETASDCGGFLEGALSAAEDVAADLTNVLAEPRG